MYYRDYFSKYKNINSKYYENNIIFRLDYSKDQTDRRLSATERYQCVCIIDYSGAVVHTTAGHICTM
jgi:hypothetical protein